MPFFRFLRGLGTDRDSAPKGLADLIGKRLSHLAPEQVELAAAYAGLMLRVAHADVHLSAQERDALPKLIAEHAGLKEQDAGLVAELVIHQANDLAGIEYSSLTEAFNHIADVEQKLRLIDCLYAIATTDASVSIEEDDEIRAVARALLLTHGQFIEVRSRYKEQLAVIQSLREVQKRS